MNVKFIPIPLYQVVEYFAKDFTSEDETKEFTYNRFYIDGDRIVFVLEEKERML